MAAAEAPQGSDRAAAAAAAAKAAADAVKASMEKRVKFLQENAALLDKFSTDLLPLLLHVSQCHPSQSFDCLSADKSTCVHMLTSAVLERALSGSGAISRGRVRHLMPKNDRNAAGQAELL